MGGLQKNWVWETGITGSVNQPIQISGLFIGNDFRATGNVQNPYYIDYKNGRVVFDSAISTSSTVKIEYSHKWVEVIPAEGVPFLEKFKVVLLGMKRAFRSQILVVGRKMGQTRIQLPALAIEVNPAKSLEPYQLGGGQYVNTDLVFYVMAENHWECANLMDAVLYQNDRNIHLFNTTAVAVSGVFPFNYRNELNENALPSGMYESLIDNFFYRKCWINDSRGSDITQLCPRFVHWDC